MGEPGRPSITEEQYKIWLEEMRPHLVLGCSLHRALKKTGLLEQGHDWVIRDKYKQGDWFSQKIDAFRSVPGENVNEALTRLVSKIVDKIKRDEECTKDELDILKFMGEKHRTAQPFFVTRTETAESDPSKVGKILDTMETDYGQLGQEASKQMVAHDAPLQDKG